MTIGRPTRIETLNHCNVRNGNKLYKTVRRVWRWYREDQLVLSDQRFGWILNDNLIAAGKREPKRHLWFTVKNRFKIAWTHD